MYYVVDQVGMNWGGLIRESQDLTSMGQHDLRINAFNKGNTYISSMRSVSYLSCRYNAGVIRVQSRYKHYVLRYMSV